jgi:hypothetical protein
MGTAQERHKFIDLILLFESHRLFYSTDEELNYVLRDDIALSQPEGEQGHRAVTGRNATVAGSSQALME